MLSMLGTINMSRTNVIEFTTNNLTRNIKNSSDISSSVFVKEDLVKTCCLCLLQTYCCFNKHDKDNTEHKELYRYSVLNVKVVNSRQKT